MQNVPQMFGKYRSEFTRTYAISSEMFFSVEGEAIHPAQGASPVGANFRLKLNVLDPPVRTPEKILPPGRCNYVEVILIENKRLSGFSDTL